MIDSTLRHLHCTQHVLMDVHRALRVAARGGRRGVGGLKAARKDALWAQSVAGGRRAGLPVHMQGADVHLWRTNNPSGALPCQHVRATTRRGTDSSGAARDSNLAHRHKQVVTPCGGVTERWPCRCCGAGCSRDDLQCRRHKVGCRISAGLSGAPSSSGCVVVAGRLQPRALETAGGR